MSKWDCTALCDDPLAESTGVEHDSSIDEKQTGTQTPRVCSAWSDHGRFVGQRRHAPIVCADGEGEERMADSLNSERFLVRLKRLHTQWNKGERERESRGDTHNNSRDKTCLLLQSLEGGMGGCVARFKYPESFPESNRKEQAVLPLWCCKSACFLKVGVHFQK